MGDRDHSRPALGIVADDLAGAADTAAQLASPERPALVSLGPRLPKDAATASACAIDADCRHAPPQECALRTEEAFGQLARIAATVAYLKLDSTLRGNVGAALQAALTAMTAAGAVLAPAFPERGRTVAGGVLLVDGAPVADTEVGRDAGASVGLSEVAAIARQQWDCAAAVFAPADFATPIALADDMARALDNRTRLLVMDARAPDDMQMIAAAIRQLGRPVLPSGSAGLARGFAEVMGGRRRTPPPSPTVETGPAPVLALIGSRTHAAGAQIDALTRAGIACLGADEPATVRRAAAILAHRRPVVIIPGSAGYEMVAACGAEIMTRCSGSALVLSGGATARRFCDLARIRHLRIAGELEPGVAAGAWVGVDLGELPLVIKGGAAGSTEAMVAAIRWIRAENGTCGGPG